MLKPPTLPIKRLSFLAKWFQKECDIVRTFILCYHREDNTAEIYEPSQGRIIMRRTKLYDQFEHDFYIGAKISIFGRVLNLIDYGDEATKKHLTPFRLKGFVVVKFSVMKDLGAILTVFAKSNIMISKALMVRFTANLARQFLGAEGKADAATSIFMRQLSAGPSIGMQIIGDNIIEVMKCAHSQTQASGLCKVPAPLFDLFKTSYMRDGFYISESQELSLKDKDFFFDPEHGPQNALTLRNSTMCIIKPHAIKDGNLGKIIEEIMGHGFQITALRMQYLERTTCQQLFDVYRGALKDYVALMNEMSSGVCMACEIVGEDPNVSTQYSFRQFCGPFDPEMARIIQPHTLRAKYGIDVGRNAVHCTDLLRDVELELQYVIKMLE